MSPRLENYLRTYRRRAGFSQDEVAFLLGAKSGTKVSRYECLSRRPLLETVLTYEVIFAVPARELFAGIYEDAERLAVARARLLARRLEKAGADRMAMHKRAALEAIYRPHR